MALRSPFFYVCLFIFNGVLGYSIDDVVDKIQNLETKLEVMYETVTQLRTENKNLKTRVEILEELIEHKDAKLQSIQVSEANESNATEAELVLDMLPESSKEIPYRKNLKRIVPIPDTSAPSAVIAFHSYLSHDSTGPLPVLYVLKYDVVPLNRGNGYKNFDGIFNVPVTGTYVFTWSTMADAHGRVHTQLMKNAEVIGTRYADSDTATVWDFSTGVVVVDAAQGDHVYIRLGDPSKGKVQSIPQSRSTFSGWLLG